jgi:uncharacterized membrane protein
MKSFNRGMYLYYGRMIVLLTPILGVCYTVIEFYNYTS